MLLIHGEVVYRTGAVDRLHKGSRNPGTLFLTNLRVVFEEKVSQGLLRGQSTHTTLDLPLERIANLLIDRPPFGRPVLRIEVPSAGSFQIKTQEVDAWLHAIATARMAIRPLPPPPPPTPQGQVVVHVQAPSAPQSFLHCHYCGALNPMGQGHGAAKCSGCGATL
ncbi:MAG: hypothetical protein L3K07_07695 [Thermoplasmata archaeon]|nr:hypothetical protein [Thermoplasmata archaeon]